MDNKEAFDVIFTLRAFSVGLGTDSAHLINSVLFSNDNSILWRFAGLSDIVMFAISFVFTSDFTLNMTVYYADPTTAARFSTLDFLLQYRYNNK